jgi:hypothetical protein
MVLIIIRFIPMMALDQRSAELSLLRLHWDHLKQSLSVPNRHGHHPTVSLHKVP